MLKLIKEAHTRDMVATQSTETYATNIVDVAAALKESVQTVNESITHALANIAMSVQSGKPVNTNLAYGRHDTLAAFIAGVELLAAQPKVSDGSRRFFAAVTVRNGQMTHLDAVAKVSQIGQEKNQQKKQVLAAAIAQYNETGDKQAAKTILDAVGRVRMAVDRALQQQAPTQPQTRGFAPA